MRKSNSFGKYGLTVNSGFIGGMHISAPYDSNGGVFVEADGGESWERMTPKRAKAVKAKIITCCQCDQPAVMMDHCYPYMNDYTLCKEHAPKHNK